MGVRECRSMQLLLHMLLSHATDYHVTIEMGCRTFSQELKKVFYHYIGVVVDLSTAFHSFAGSVCSSSSFHLNTGIYNVFDQPFIIK